MSLLIRLSGRGYGLPSRRLELGGAGSHKHDEVTLLLGCVFVRIAVSRDLVAECRLKSFSSLFITVSQQA